MKGLKETLINEAKRLDKLIKSTMESLQGAPTGNLRLSSSHNSPQFYFLNPENPKKNGTYIPKEQVNFARKLAQKEYDLKIIKLATTRLKQIKTILQTYQDAEIDNVFESEHPERKKLIVPVESTWEQKVQKWYSVQYTGKAFSEDVPLILTEKGERVRSKSEKIIADFLFRKGILYKYECPLTLKGFGTIYPDFTLLSEKYNAEIYIEHEGKMDNPEYAENGVRKIDLYERNGIFMGERLILTFETSTYMINIALLEMRLQRSL